MALHLTQGTFSFLPPFTDEEIRAQVEYCLDNGWAINVEFTDDPHPRNTYWERQENERDYGQETIEILRISRADLVTIEAEEILASRVFSEGRPDEQQQQ
jgi:ribulose bisphosphate carboxylase small subunit